LQESRSDLDYLMKLESRVKGAWWGSFIGDALAMPAHWYYQRHLIATDYGSFEDYARPKAQHPDSILWRSSYESTSPLDNILHEQRAYWGKRDVHYHQFLKAGENTLNLKLAALLAESLEECGNYNQSDYVKRYTDFMLTAGKHHDTYVEEYHRGFFKNHAAGKPPGKCGINDQHIGGLATLVPLILYFHQDLDKLLKVVDEHVQLTHKNTEVLRAARAFARLLTSLLEGKDLATALSTLGASAHPCFALPLAKWASEKKEEEIVGNHFSPACYIEDAFPASIFITVKYAGRFREGLQANVRLGGDNCHRGVVVGALLGAIGGEENIPAHWIKNLVDYVPSEESLSGYLDHFFPIVEKTKNC
jgi:ADP-ribosyl-[dinitrogen reductase] hydrolase